MGFDSVRETRVVVLRGIGRVGKGMVRGMFECVIMCVVMCVVMCV